MNIEIANRLVELRKKSGLSQEELADKLGLSRQAVSKWERAEASPDTDNLICLAKLYNVSLDDLLKTDVPVDDIVREQKEKTEEAKKEEPHEENRGSSKRDDHISIGVNGIHISSEDGDEVHIDKNGIHIDDKDGTHVHLGKDNYKEFMKEKKVKILGIISSVTALCAVVAYLLVGFFVNTPWGYGSDNSGWCVGWLIFFLVPVIPSIFEAIFRRRVSRFNVPVLAVGIFLLVGLTTKCWHPTWVIFFAIPIFYSITKPIEHSLDEKNGRTGIKGDVAMEIDEDDDD